MTPEMIMGAENVVIQANKELEIVINEYEATEAKKGVKPENYDYYATLCLNVDHLQRVLDKFRDRFKPRFSQCFAKKE